MYVNGVNVTPNTSVTSATMVANNDPLTIGMGLPDCNGGGYSDGAIAEPFVFATALTQAQIQSIYNYGMAGVSYNAYYISLSSNPQQVLEDSARLTAVSSKAVLSPGTFWFDAADSRLYIYTLTGDDPSGHIIEIGARISAITVNAGNNLTFSGITLHGSQRQGLAINGSTSNLLVNDCVAEWNYDGGLTYYGGAVTSTGITVENSTFRYNGASGIETSVSNFSGWSIIGNQIHSNAQIVVDASGNPVSGGEDQVFDGGIHMTGVGNSSSGTVISNNLVYSNGTALQANGQSQGAGIWMDTVSGVTVEDNVVYGNWGPGVFLEKNINSSAVYNVVYGNGLWGLALGGYYGPQPGSANVLVTAGDRLNSTGNLIANNTIYGGWLGISLGNESNSSDTGQTSNNIVRNNIVVGASSSDLYTYLGGDNDSLQGSGNVYDHNAFGVAASNFIAWRTSNYSLYSAWEAATGNCGSTGCSRSLEADPLMVAPATGNFLLQPTSPALAAGVFIPGVSTENPPNIGAK